MKVTLELQIQMWTCLKSFGYDNEECGYIQKDVDIMRKIGIHLLPKPLSLSELLLLTIKPMDHQAYGPSSLTTIKPIDH